MRIYGSKVSYFTGKLESYLRYKGIEHELLGLPKHEREIKAQLGSTQMPAVQLDDGRWMSDTTPILLYLEEQYPDRSILPGDPVLLFVAHLIEDYADEWLWRPAMHYRWTYRHDRELLSSKITDELLGHIPLPRFLKRRMVALRQRTGFVIGDGVSKSTQAHVEQGYFRALENMSRMLEHRPYLLGRSPSIADFGLMGPMLRHFGQDPTPAELMRERAPRVYEWVARLWNETGGGPDAAAERRGVEAVPEDTLPMLREICETHLRQLSLNADAFSAGQTRFEGVIQGCTYRSLPVSRYRVWCLERLRERYEGLGDEDRGRVKSLLPFPEAEILWNEKLTLRSGYDEKREAPFNRAINVYGKGYPR